MSDQAVSELRIGERVYRKGSSATIEVPLDELDGLRLWEIPYYSTVDIGGLPGSSDSYGLSIGSTHAGGPGNDQLNIKCHVSFWVNGTSEDREAVATVNRKRRHIKRWFRECETELSLGLGPEWSPFMEAEGKLYGLVAWYRDIARSENPEMRSLARPFITRFEALLTSRSPLVFVCHASEDKPFVERLCDFLDHQEVPVWYDKREIRVGDSIVGRINEGIGAASHVVVVLSKTSVKRPWVAKELSSALMLQLRDSDIVVLPILIEECRVPPLLADVRFADCRANETVGLQELAAALK